MEMCGAVGPVTNTLLNHHHTDHETNGGAFFPPNERTAAQSQSKTKAKVNFILISEHTRPNADKDAETRL